MNLAELRTEFMRAGLNEADVASDPVVQCQKWLEEAVAAEFIQPNAMTLATANRQTGQPSARIVLLKDLSEEGFIFYTNAHSHKGEDMRSNAKVSLLFYWDELERQIRVEGEVSIIDAARADRYFASRPRESNLGAWASQQSQVIAGRHILEQRCQELAHQFNKQTVPRPPHWQGYCVHPHKIEFWQGRANRLHDRLCFVRQNDDWQLIRLAP